MPRTRPPIPPTPEISDTQGTRTINTFDPEEEGEVRSPRFGDYDDGQACELINWVTDFTPFNHEMSLANGWTGSFMAYLAAYCVWDRAHSWSDECPPSWRRWVKAMHTFLQRTEDVRYVDIFFNPQWRYNVVELRQYDSLNVLRALRETNAPRLLMSARSRMFDVTAQEGARDGEGSAMQAAVSISEQLAIADTIMTRGGESLPDRYVTERISPAHPDSIFQGRRLASPAQDVVSRGPNLPSAGEGARTLQPRVGGSLSARTRQVLEITASSPYEDDAVAWIPDDPDE